MKIVTFFTIEELLNWSALYIIVFETMLASLASTAELFEGIGVDSDLLRRPPGRVLACSTAPAREK